MTEELRQKANTLHRRIEDLTAQVQIVEAMHHCDCDLYIGATSIGQVTMAGDDELKDDIIDIILNRLNTKKGEVEDEYRRL